MPPPTRSAFRAAAATLLATGLVAGANAVRAQIPDHFTNLRVLPRKISKEDLTRTMRGFSFALGVRCEHCHVPKPGAPSGQGSLDLDFASDKRPAKATARVMMKMVADLNRRYLAKLEPRATLEVECGTCHRGIARPEPLAALMRRTVADSGAAVAAARYAALRDRFYGSASYDFSEQSLDTAAEGLLQDGKAAEAVALLELNARHNPASGQMQWLMGDAYLAAGDRVKARAAYQKSLEFWPNNPRVKKALESLDAGAPKQE